MLDFNCSTCGFQAKSSNSSYSPLAKYGSALYSVTRSTYTSTMNSWDIVFDPSVDTTDSTVYLLIMVYVQDYAQNACTLTVTSSDSSVPIFAESLDRKIGCTSKSYRQTMILCNSQSYHVEVNNYSNSDYVYIAAYYTGAV